MDKRPIITIITVNYNTSDFIGLMLYALKQLTMNSYKVLICDNGSDRIHLMNLINVAKKYDNIKIIFRQQKKVGSIAHAEALDLLVSNVETEYFVVMDSDAVFLKKYWDDILISNLKKNVKAIGAPLPPTVKNIKPRDFPLVFAVLYETAIFNKLNLSFMPDDLSSNKNRDTGWQIRERYIENGYKGIVFDSCNTKFTNNTIFGNIYCAVYYFKDEIIASHFGRGSSDGVAKYSNKWYFKLPFLSIFIKKYIGKRERRQWIDKCYEIIDSQII